MGSVIKLRQRPAPVNKDMNPYMPSRKAINAFKLPPHLEIRKIESVAVTIDLSELGITIPRCAYPDRFEAGVRYGLAHNRRTNIKEHFRPSFSSGFCAAKMFYRTIAPNHPLAASGSFKASMTPQGKLRKIKDV